MTTGKTIDLTRRTFEYYGGTVAGLASIYSAVDECNGVPVHSVFDTKDLDNYFCVPAHECPLCKEGQMVDGVVTSYGFSHN